jgi:hypothetical protein
MNTHTNRNHSAESGLNRKRSRWLKKHKKAVTLVSALTVLTSFIVKETLDEPVKDTLGAVQEAIRDNDTEQGGIYTQLTDINTNLRAVRELENRLSATLNKIALWSHNGLGNRCALNCNGVWNRCPLWPDG